MRRGLRARRADAGAAVSAIPGSQQMFKDSGEGKEETKEAEGHEKETLGCQESNKSLVLFAVFLLSPLLLLLLLPISCGDLSFPAGQMLISYLSLGLRVEVYGMGRGGGKHEREGIWAGAKNNL